MPIIFARVDDRLIPGQVAPARLPEPTADATSIPCLKGKESCLNRGLLRLSLPYEYELTILDSHSCARYAENSKRRIFLLMSSLAELTDLIKDGLQLKSVNIGGMHFKEGAQKLDDNVFLNETDKRFLKLISDLGINIETRAVPTSATLSMREVLP